jgi:hypothetical protein
VSFKHKEARESNRIRHAARGCGLMFDRQPCPSHHQPETDIHTRLREILDLGMASFIVYKGSGIPSSSDRDIITIIFNTIINTIFTAIHVPSNPQLQFKQDQQAIFKSKFSKRTYQQHVFHPLQRSTPSSSIGHHGPHPRGFFHLHL